MKIIHWLLMSALVGACGKSPEFGQQRTISDCVNLSGNWRSIKPWDASLYGGDSHSNCREPDPYPVIFQEGCSKIKFGRIGDSFEIGKRVTKTEAEGKATDEFSFYLYWQDRETLSFELSITRKENWKANQTLLIRESYKKVGEQQVEYNREDLTDSKKVCWQKNSYISDPKK